MREHSRTKLPALPKFPAGRKPQSILISNPEPSDKTGKNPFLHKSRLLKKKRRLLPGIMLTGIVAFLIASGLYSCPVRLIFGIPCPGCHMSRALLLLLKLDFAGSFYEHPMATGTIVLGAICFGLCFFLGLEKSRCRKVIRKSLIVWCVLMSGLWLWRMLFVWSGNQLFNPDSLAGFLFGLQA